LLVVAVVVVVVVVVHSRSIIIIIIITIVVAGSTYLSELLPVLIVGSIHPSIHHFMYLTFMRDTCPHDDGRDGGSPSGSSGILEEEEEGGKGGERREALVGIWFPWDHRNSRGGRL